MKKDNLSDDLAYYGFPLLGAHERRAPEEVLENLAKQEDPRLWEAFPVVLAHVLKEKRQLLWERRTWKPGSRFSGKALKRFTGLLALSALLLRNFGWGKPDEARVFKLVGQCQDGPAVLKKLEGPFSRSEDFELNGVRLSSRRYAENFRNYMFQRSADRKTQDKQQTLGLELLLSELFTPRQKELLRKRESGQTLTKTEKEYFYRVVKKRLKALASPELHGWARGLLE